jgi:hypothetical protein
VVQDKPGQASVPVRDNFTAVRQSVALLGHDGMDPDDALYAAAGALGIGSESADAMEDGIGAALLRASVKVVRPTAAHVRCDQCCASILHAHRPSKMGHFYL